MMKKTQLKRLLSVLLAMLLLALSLPAVFGEDAVENGYCGGEEGGTNLTWTLDSEGKLTVGGTGDMADYAPESSPFFEKAEIKTVTIEAGVTGIGAYAFEACSAASLELPDGVARIGAGGFSGCENLKSIVIPGTVTVIGEGAFSGCSKLTDVSYTGTMKKWKAITIERGNEPLKNATIHFTILSEPVEEAPEDDSCPYCGGTHEGFPGVIIGLIHNLLAAFGLKGSKSIELTLLTFI